MNRRKIASALVITLFLFSMTTLIKPSYASPSDIHVYPGGSIQTAINSANPYDTIIVHEGTYNENVDVNKTVNLLAEGAVTVNALNPSDHIFYVTASYVNITGFIVAGATRSGNAGIHLDHVSHCNISNNNASNNSFGIYLYHSSDNTLINNTSNENDYGIFLSYSSNNKLINNTANSNDDMGIYLEYYSNYNTLADNMVYGNDYGIQIGESSDNLIFHNNLINNTLNGYDSNPALNDWHHTILLEGNYWSDYNGLDDGSGTGKHAIAGDGIGDTLIPHPDRDYDFYPFTSQDRWKKVETATGTGIATFDSDAIAFGNIEAVDESELPSVGKPDLYFTHGFFSFLVVDLTPDQTIIVTIEFPSNIPIGSQYWEYNIGWFQMPIEDDDGDNTIIIEITDGGLGDEDGVVNGVIVHTGGIGVIKVPPVGGFTMFANVFDILAPWIGIGLAVTISITAIAFMMRRRKGFAD